jgi:hypothetical protein
LGEAEVDFIVALIMEWINEQERISFMRIIFKDFLRLHHIYSDIDSDILL